MARASRTLRWRADAPALLAGSDCGGARGTRPQRRREPAAPATASRRRRADAARRRRAHRRARALDRRADRREERDRPCRAAGARKADRTGRDAQEQACRARIGWSASCSDPCSGCACCRCAYAFQRFPRLMREMSADLDKPAKLVIEGGDTEADKAIVEMLVRAARARAAQRHGSRRRRCAVRAAAGKPAVATIRMRAFREGEHVMVEVADDGGGVDVARVRRGWRKERNVAPAETLAAMSDEEVDRPDLRARAFRRRPQSPGCRAAASAWTRCARR